MQEMKRPDHPYQTSPARCERYKLYGTNCVVKRGPKSEPVYVVRLPVTSGREDQTLDIKLKLVYSQPIRRQDLPHYFVFWQPEGERGGEGRGGGGQKKWAHSPPRISTSVAVGIRDAFIAV